MRTVLNGLERMLTQVVTTGMFHQEMSQGELAREVGIARVRINRILNGRERCSTDTWVRLIEATDPAFAEEVFPPPPPATAQEWDEAHAEQDQRSEAKRQAYMAEVALATRAAEIRARHNAQIGPKMGLDEALAQARQELDTVG